jgi:GGDEF domain-containing protein
VAYPVIGASATLAVAAGLLLVRLSPAGLGWDAVRAEVLGNVAMYLYVAIVIMAVFVGLGAALGYQTDRLVTQTTTDPLTGLHNRRALQERIDEELRRSARYGKSLSLLLIDLDKFKQVNDRCGHLAGDALLCAIGQAIQRTMRKTDYAARLGGDGFAIVSPNTGGADAAPRQTSETGDCARRAGSPANVTINRDRDLTRRSRGARSAHADQCGRHRALRRQTRRQEHLQMGHFALALFAGLPALKRLDRTAPFRRRALLTAAGRCPWVSVRSRSPRRRDRPDGDRIRRSTNPGPHRLRVTALRALGR